MSLVGCSTESDDESPVPFSDSDQQSRSTTTTHSTETASSPAPTETVPSDFDRWRGIDDPWTDVQPTGVPAFRDDSQWRIWGHDAGHTYHNPYASGPDNDPTVRWTYDSGGSYWDQQRYLYPLIVDGTVYTGIVREDHKGGFVAIDADTGDAETIIETEAYLWKPTVIDETVYAVLDGSIGAFDLSEGTQLWQTEPLFSWPSPPLCVNGTVVSGRSGEVFGFDAATGEQKWNTGQSGLNSYNGRPIITDGLVLQSGMGSLLDLNTGEHRTTLPEEIHYPTVANGNLYMVANDGPVTGLISLDWETFDLKWVIPENDNRLMLGASPGVVGDSVLSLQTKDKKRNRIVARSQETGTQQWSTDRIQPSPKFIVTDSDTAYLVSPMFPVIALDLETGNERWRFTPSGDTVLGCGVALADDLLVVTDGAGKVWALE
ncbi:outer membrane protein assembly factor BamB family protein [Halodesulfurarchaeum sp.]|uniref:outer membrane protein assembly factor BamB family protein n=1 Tax=Halodesulfurarchaeum sp. TaxID=1980530 RepID=UPI002FC3A329